MSNSEGRTEEQFAEICRRAIDFIKMHRLCVWVVPEPSGYALSRFKPRASDVPRGTTALLYYIKEDALCVLDEVAGTMTCE